MITLKSIGYLHGYTGEDHNLSDHELDELVGREFRSVKDIGRATATLCSGPGKVAPIVAEVLFADGETREVRIG